MFFQSISLSNLLLCNLFLPNNSPKIYTTKLLVTKTFLYQSSCSNYAPKADPARFQ